MDKSLLINALKELDRQVTHHFKIIIVGGAAMVIHFGATRATRDIDAIFEGDNLREILQASKIVAAKFHLAEDWLNDSVRDFQYFLEEQEWKIN